MAEMIPVQSSNIRAIGFEPEEEPVDENEPWGTLAIEFTSGKTYRYFDVPEEEFEALRDANSVGAYFHAHIRTAGYSFEQVT